MLQRIQSLFDRNRRALHRRATSERAQWPIRNLLLEPDEDIAAVRQGMLSAAGWLANAAAQWNGGYSARYNLLNRNYQGPYPETTGYLIPTLLDVVGAGENGKMYERATSAAAWLRRRQRDDGAIRCNIDTGGEHETETDKIILFDCGAILQGFSALAEKQDTDCREAATRLADFMCSCQCPDGTWDRYLYFADFGTHNALVAYSLIDAARTLGNPAFGKAGRMCLSTLRSRILPSGFIQGCEFGRDPTTMFLHAYAYTLEGYVKAAIVDDDDELLQTAVLALDRMCEAMDQTDLLPAAYLDDSLSPASDYTVTTGLAQLADQLFKVGRVAKREDFFPPARKIMRLLRQLMIVDAGDAAAVGGIPASYPIDGGYGPYTINNWTMKYFVDASLEELSFLNSSLIK